MLVLGIESSCDECSLALVRDGTEVLGLQTHSQIEKHEPYRGVVPELASRLHVEKILGLYELLIKESGIAAKDLEGIAVTRCPGLRGSLLVGVQFARGLALSLGLPLVGIDHIEAHIYSPLLETNVSYPYVSVVVSGGHSVFSLVKGFSDIDVRGVTLDDACGEVFDKIARELGFAYPGGPKLDVCAEKGDRRAADFPRYSIKNGYDVSYSGLKTAVLHHREKYWNKAYKETTENIAAAFRYAAIEMVVERALALAKESKVDCIAFGGGVAQNKYLRQRMQEQEQIRVVFPRAEYCIDNAAMIAGLGFQYLSRAHQDAHESAVSVDSAHDFTVDSRNHRFMKKTKTIILGKSAQTTNKRSSHGQRHT